MATPSTAPRVSGPRKRPAKVRPAGRGADPHREDRIADLLQHATNVFFQKGYEGASMRDISRESGMSLAGLYHYFDSKERLLYLIQKQAFDTNLEEIKRKLASTRDAEERVRMFIRNHLEYFLTNKKQMKVLSHEDEALTGEMAREIRELKREYYKLCAALIDGMKREKGLEFSSRIAVLSLFGMVNWIYTWHNPKTDADAGALAQQMADIFLCGILNSNGARAKRRK
jgi:AcrR family transcriptional regulator